MTEEQKAKQEGAYEAWCDLFSRFTETQRLKIASKMAHNWTIVGVKLESPDGYSKVFTPD